MDYFENMQIKVKNFNKRNQILSQHLVPDELKTTQNDILSDKEKFAIFGQRPTAVVNYKF